MKHLKTFESEDQDLLTQMQGLDLAPKPLGFYISLCSYGDSDISALGVALVGPSLAAIAQMLYEEFNMDDLYDETNEANWNSISDVMEKFTEDNNEYDISSIYRFWQMTPKTNNVKEEIIETETLMTPYGATELGKKHFRDFEDAMRKNPEGD
jgi:hypothetical protein